MAIRKLCCAVLGFVCVFVFKAGADDVPNRITVLSYNIHHAEGVDGRLDLKRIAQVIQSVDPDIVALQEVDRLAQRTGGVDQPAELARLTELNVLFEKNISLGAGEYGNAVLTKLPVESHHNEHLPRFDESEQRGALLVTLKKTETRPAMLFVATHLDHRRPDRERLASARRINEMLKDDDQMPAILAGDLNAERDSEVLKEFGRHWQQTADKELPTIPVAEPRRQIDFILFRPANRWQVVETRVLDEAIASDHRAILSVLEFLP